MPAPTQAINNIYENIRYFDAYKSGDYMPLRYNISSNGDYDLKDIEKIENLSYQAIEHTSSIDSAIEESKYILGLKYNWDDEGALAISQKAYEKAISFLKMYAESIADVCECECELIAPSINPVKNGSVDLEWNLETSYMLINFTDSKDDFVYYYLAFKEGDTITFDANGQVNATKISDKFSSHLVSLS